MIGVMAPYEEVIQIVDALDSIEDGVLSSTQRGSQSGALGPRRCFRLRISARQAFLIWRPVMLFVGGTPSMMNGVALPNDPTVVTTARGEAALNSKGFRTTVVSVEDSWFYRGRQV